MNILCLLNAIVDLVILYGGAQNPDPNPKVHIPIMITAGFLFGWNVCGLFLY